MSDVGSSPLCLEGKIRFTYERDTDLFTAIDEDSSLTGDGHTKAEALEMLTDRLKLHQREDVVPSTEEQDEILRSIGLNPDEIEEVPVEDQPEWFR